jgi:hypothetical protein
MSCVSTDILISENEDMKKHKWKVYIRVAELKFVVEGLK